ncbi:MAG: M28 family peptidase [Paludibacteraceae bacterium]|nr:M28 family peptidase [Paludibacteraceae bacterium]
MPRKNYIFLLAALLLALTACNRKAARTTIRRPDFNADSAYAFVEKQLAFGPRVPNSEGHTRCAVWLIEQLRAYGAQVELQKGNMPDYRGNNQQVYNIIAHFPAADSLTAADASRPRILLCAHYDTRPWCDEEEDYSDRFYNVPGANDGASGVAVLLEVARQLGLRKKCLNDSINDQMVNDQMVNDQMVNTPVDIVFFDCEDMGTPRFYTGQQRENTWCLGSQLWAADYTNDQMVNDRMVHPRYAYGILLDMVGAPDALFPREYYSSRYAANYQELIWRRAAELGHGRFFSNKPSYPITDDHYYINLAGIPCVDIIHYDPNATGFAHWWHTRNDDISNISPTTLRAVGETILSLL